MSLGCLVAAMASGAWVILLKQQKNTHTQIQRLHAMRSAQTMIIQMLTLAGDFGCRQLSDDLPVKIQMPGFEKLQTRKGIEWTSSTLKTVRLSEFWVPITRTDQDHFQASEGITVQPDDIWMIQDCYKSEAISLFVRDRKQKNIQLKTPLDNTFDEGWLSKLVVHKLTAEDGTLYHQVNHHPKRPITNYIDALSLSEARGILTIEVSSGPLKWRQQWPLS